MNPGTKVRVQFPSTGCPCGCGRTQGYDGVIAKGDDRYRGILVRRSDGKKFYEYPTTVKVLK